MYIEIFRKRNWLLQFCKKIRIQIYVNMKNLVFETMYTLHVAAIIILQNNMCKVFIQFIHEFDNYSKFDNYLTI